MQIIATLIYTSFSVFTFIQNTTDYITLVNISVTNYAMRTITRLTIILLLFSVAALAQNHNNIVPGRLVINLGSSPWRFKKLSQQGDNDSIISKKLTVSGEAMPQVKLAELKGPATISLLTNYFQDTSIHRAYYKIEASADKVNWFVLSDKTAAGAVVGYQSSDTVKSTGNTVGYVENKKSAYISVPLKGKYRFIRLTVTKLLKSHGTPVLSARGGLYLYGADGGASSDGNYQAASFKRPGLGKRGYPALL